MILAVLPQALILTALVVLISYHGNVEGGFPGVFCPSYFSRRVLLDCSRDCILAHSAIYGRCGRRFNCHCGFPKDKTTNTALVQCLNASHPTWAEICTIDCQCDHGALGGRCNWETHGCECIGSTEIGTNMCPFTKFSELVYWFNASYITLGHPEIGNALLKPLEGKGGTGWQR